MHIPGDTTIEGTRIRTRFQDMGAFGEGMAEWASKPLFVPYTIPDEEAEVEITKVGRSYVRGRLLQIHTPSPRRVAPRCQYFGVCSGCQLQHIDYAFQLELKRRMVSDQLRRLGGFQDPLVQSPIPCQDPWYYRNRADFTVGPEGKLGFVQRESRRFLPIEQCPIMHPRINETLAMLQGRGAETTALTIRYGVGTGDLMIQPHLKNPALSFSSGQSTYHEDLLGRRFQISASSFFQVNTAQAEGLVHLIKDALRLSGREFIVDAYSGVGTFAALLAPYCGRVFAIEDSAAAVKDARVNLEGLSNVEQVQAKTEELLLQLPEVPYGMVLDPPRTGCQPKAINALAKLGPERIVYVSCFPATLARDLASFCQKGYTLTQVQPSDLFPQTCHIECVATLVKGT